MASYFRPNNFRLSSSAFLWGRLVYTEHSTGCLRKILLQSREVSGPVAEKYTILGEQNEVRHAAVLDAAGVTYQRETPIERTSRRVPGVTITGHADFLIEDPTTLQFSEVHELKSVSSANTKRETIDKGFIKPENLAQLVAYMGEFDIERGKLIYTYYKDGDVNKVTAERTFEVTVDEYGRICVNGSSTQFTAYDIIAHRNAAIEVIATGEIADRPYRHDAPFNSPCQFCSFRSACERHDNGEFEGTDAFVLAAKTALGGSNE